MLAVERRKAILDIIIQNGRALVTELATNFIVTEETVRRDLEELERRGLIIRTHGGAIPFDEGLPDLSAEIRETVNSNGKRAIAKEAAKYIKHGDTLFFDASTTVFFLACEIKNITDITVITNSLRIINELSSNDGIKLICAGGTLSGANKSFTGNSAGEFIRQNYFAEKCFISCAGVTLEGGMLESREDEASVKKSMCENSKKVILLCDKTKLGRSRLHIIAPLNATDTIITDIEASNGLAIDILSKGINIEFV